MIALKKTTKPSILVKNAAKWTSTLLSNQAKNIESTKYLLARYCAPEIKQQLIKETKGKCVYCESLMLHIHHGDVEHIFPKSIDQSKRYEWDNLTLACEICNQNKSNNDPNLNYILNPYVEDPKNSLHFCGSLIISLDNKGLNTIHLIKLNRTELIERRQERLDKLILIVQNLTNEQLPISTRRAILDDLIKNETPNDKEYTAMTKGFIEILWNKLPTDITDGFSLDY